MGMPNRLMALLLFVLLVPLISACNLLPQLPSLPQPNRPTEPPPTSTVSPEAPGERQPLPPDEIFRQRRESVVLVRARMAATPFSPPALGTGSGIVITVGEELVILTAAHVVEGASSVAVSLAGSNQERAARVAGISSCDDLAILTVSDTTGLTPAPLGQSADLENGQPVVLMGYPLNARIGGVEPSISQGIVSQRDRAYEEFPSVVQHDAESDGGYSGGPLFNRFGEVVGVHVMRVGQGVRFAISADYAKKLIERLAGGERLNYLGMNLRAVELEDGSRGVIVDGVDTGSPAAEAAIAPADLVISLEGAPVRTKADMCNVLRSRADGDSVRLQLARLLNDPPTLLDGQLTINRTGGGNTLQAPNPQPTPVAAAPEQRVAALQLSNEDEQRLLAAYQQAFAQSTEVRFETFDNPKTKHYWYQHDGPAHASRYDRTGGTYQFTLRAAGTPANEYLRVYQQEQLQVAGPHYLVEVAVNFNGSPGSSAGAVVNGQANGDHIRFVISSDGTFDVITQAQGQERPEYTLRGSPSPAIIAGTNRLQVLHQADQIIFWINHKSVAVMLGQPFTSGTVGITAAATPSGTVPITVLTDDFRLRVF